jgi:hypothetical protein
VRTQGDFGDPSDFFGLLEILANHATNSLDFFDRMDCALTASLDFAVPISSKIDSCYFFDDAKLAPCLDETKDFFVIDSKAKDFCCFHKWNFRGFFVRENSFSVYFQCLSSIVPNSKDFDVRKGIDGCGTTGTWLCVFLGEKCGRDCWGRSTYVICCVVVHSPRRYCHSSSKSCWIHKDRVSSERTLNALESDELALLDLSWVKA